MAAPWYADSARKLAAQGVTCSDAARALGVPYGRLFQWARYNCVNYVSRGVGRADRVVQMRRVRVLLKQGVSSSAIQEETGADASDIATQRILMRAAGVDVASGSAAKSSASRQMIARRYGNADHAPDLCGVFEIQHSASSLKYWGVSDE